VVLLYYLVHLKSFLDVDRLTTEELLKIYDVVLEKMYSLISEISVGDLVQTLY
jgi:hypothetical protein